MPWAAGDELPADALNKMGCHLQRASAQSISDNTFTNINWDTENEDTDNLWTSTSAAVITIRETGLWAITLTVTFADPTTSRTYFQITPSTGFGNLRHNITVSGETIGTMSVVVPMTASSFFTVGVLRAGASTMTAELMVYRVVGGA